MTALSMPIESVSSTPRVEIRVVSVYAGRTPSSEIAIDPAIMGGSPVIRGTRISVHAVLARVERGDSVDDWVREYPEVSRAAFEAAIEYARAHPRSAAHTKRFR